MAENNSFCKLPIPFIKEVLGADSQNLWIIYHLH